MPGRLILIIAASTGLFAQTQPAAASHGQAAGTAQPGAPTVVVAPSGPSVYVVGGGFYGTGVYLVPYGTMPFQSAGVSLGGRAGISLETPLQPGFITALSSVIPGAVIYGPSQFAGMPEAALAETTRPIYDLGPSYYAGEAVAGKAERSLGEVAAEYKKGHPRAVKVYTNADAERLAKP